MNTYDFVHMALHAMGGEIKGKTKLQKTMYFLGILTGTIEELEYRPHYYGPYSSAVKDAVNRLKALDFVVQSSVPPLGVDRRGFEMARRDFRLTEDGRAMAERKAAADPAFWRRLQEAAGRLRVAGEQDYMLMSVAAKTFFILRERGRSATPVEVAEAARDLDWNPSPAEIDEAARYLQRMGLATVS